MFRSASQIDSERTASSLRRIKANWERTADNWFTGSVDSIDRRIALCERLIHQASQATGRLLDRPESAHYMKLANDLRADHEALTQMRRDLLTAAVDRDPEIRTAISDLGPGKVRGWGGHNIGGIPAKFNDDYGPLPDQETLRREIAADEGSGDDLADEYQDFLDENDLPHDSDALDAFIAERGGMHQGDWSYLMQKFSR